MTLTKRLSLSGATNQGLSSFRSAPAFVVLSQMQQAGVLGTLDQTFTCPDLVKEALCDAAMLQKSVRAGSVEGP